MKKEFVEILTSYLMGWKNIRDVAEWLSGIDWDINLDSSMQKLAGRMELLSTEVSEGLRPEAEFWSEAVSFVADESGLLFSQPISILETTVTSSSNNSSIGEPEFIIGMATEEEESQSWSILPLPVSG